MMPASAVLFSAPAGCVSVTAQGYQKPSVLHCTVICASVSGTLSYAALSNIYAPHSDSMMVRLRRFSVSSTAAGSHVMLSL